jgi:hypothetical protein
MHITVVKLLEKYFVLSGHVNTKVLGIVIMTFIFILYFVMLEFY